MEDDILIDNYLKGLLSKDEEQFFLERLKSDIKFNENFKLEEQLFNALNEKTWSFANYKNDEIKTYKKLLEQDDLQNLKKTLNRVNEKFKEIPKKKTKFNYYYLVAASIVILLCLSIFLNQGETNQQLVEDYLDTSNLPSFVSRGETTVDDLIKAQHFFENEEYQKSLDIFITALHSNEPNASIYLYTGISQLKLDKYDEAELTFDKLIESDFLDAPKGYWYKALLYLKQDKIEKTKTVLEKIISEKLHNHVKAKELLNKLEND